MGVLLVYSVCPPFTSYDSYYTVPTMLSLLRHGSFAVDAFVPAAPAVADFGLDCVPPHGKAIPYDAVRGCPGGHVYSFYPIGTTLLALPAAAAVMTVSKAIAAAFPGAHHLIKQPAIAAFLNGDPLGSYQLIELWSGAFIGALAACVVYRTALRFLPPRQALFVVLIFAFGTTQWSTASRALWQHGPSVLLLAVALDLLLEGRIAIAALPLAAAFITRPSNFIAVALLTIYVAAHHRALLPRFLLWASPVAALFFIHNLSALHSLWPRYYSASAPAFVPWLWGFTANLFSPSRGLLVFTPVVLFAAAGMVLAIRNRWCFPLAAYLVAIIASHAILIGWYWSGHSYGPRYFADMAPFLVFFLIPAIQYWNKLLRGSARRSLKWAFLALAGWGILVHGEGAVSARAQLWNEKPAEVDQHIDRIWDWRDAQFLRGLP